jgi:hypothetical protein
MENKIDRRWSYKQTRIVLVVFAVGVLLAIIQPVWFTPPDTASTVIVYALLAVAWIPVLFVLMFTYRNFIRPVAGLGCGGLFVCLVLSALFGPAVGAVMGIGPKDCTSHEIAPGQIEYVCISPGLLSHNTSTFRGPTGFPLMYRVSTAHVSTD